MANIALPLRFKTKLDENQDIDGYVKSTLYTFGDILKDNKLYFFAGFTDHGISHIEKVLASSDDLITKDTFDEILTVQDIGYYCLSVILHDIGMHLGLEGFTSIVQSGIFDDVRVAELDKLTWKDLWYDFLNEAKKFSGKQLMQLFGDENKIIRIPPLEKPGEISEDDKLLIGEFLRRHHARLAHEIALNGFPGKSSVIEFAKDVDPKIRNLVGLIARSHGMGLRKCTDYLERVYGNQTSRFLYYILPSYLMVLLRISDYIQIDSTRTSKTLVKIKTFASPFSKNEHDIHLAIDSVDATYQNDPEKIFVSSSPKNSQTYLKIRKLVADIQSEFDTSWAVLGEMYGSTKKNPAIKYRRITSNLDDENFSVGQEYVTDAFAFRANDEIVKLLISPLYGDDPKYGVRELLQNAIDACKERELLEKSAGNSSYVPEVKIEIVANEGLEPYFLISDNGIGMDVDVIKNYFLSAGASFRKSLEWMKDYMDEDKNTKVQRSGRFGIGLLAAFLIGKEIYVETRKKDSNIGFRFQAELASEQINIVKDKSIKYGTTIKIVMTKEILERFKPDHSTYSRRPEWFEWFTLANPHVRYLYIGTELVPYKKFDPDYMALLPAAWDAIDSVGYNKILWTYDDKFSKAEVTCNGIVIPDKGSISQYLQLDLIARLPKVSIFDNNALLPLNISRDSFTKKLSFGEELKTAICKDFIAKLLTFSNVKQPSNEIELCSYQLGYSGAGNYWGSSWAYGQTLFQHYWEKRTYLHDMIYCSKQGFTLCANYFIKKLKKIEILLIQSDSWPQKNKIVEIDLKDKYFHFFNFRINSINDYKALFDGSNFNSVTGQFEPLNSRFFMKSEKYPYIFKGDRRRVSQWLENKCLLRFQKEGWTCLELDNPVESLITEEFLYKHLHDINLIREYELSCFHEGNKTLNELFERYIGNNVIIPYSIEERKEKYSLAFNELASYMKKYE